MKSKEKEYQSNYWKKWRIENKPYKTIKTCKICGESFDLIHGKINRCEKCKTIVCKYCGKSFVPKNGQYNKKYCCKICCVESQKGFCPQQLIDNRGTKPRTYHLEKRDKHGSAFDRDWRSAVFVRDNYTCQECKSVGGKLQAHHIKPYKSYPELRHDLSNGVTLCVECHKKTDSYGWQNYHKNKIISQRMQQEVLSFE